MEKEKETEEKEEKTKEEEETEVGLEEVIRKRGVTLAHGCLEEEAFRRNEKNGATLAHHRCFRSLFKLALTFH